MGKRSPSVVVLAGPNGAGKSTAAPELLKGTLKVFEFVNADVIAQGLSGFDPMSAAMAAGRIMLQRLHELADKRKSFAFETTLASRSYAPWIRELKGKGYRFHLVYLWLSSADVAVARVANRVQLGGHDVPEATIRRRYELGRLNFVELYQPLADNWRVYDNAAGRKRKLISSGEGNLRVRVIDHVAWRRFLGGLE